MSKGTKNYFRHSFFAHEDEKIQELMDKVGPIGYYWFFVLCEIAGRQCVENDADPRTFVATIWANNLCLKMKIKRNKLVRSLGHLQDILGMSWECPDNQVSYLIPNLWKYLGSYNSSSPNKRKENKRKEKEEKEKISSAPEFENFDEDIEILKYSNDGPVLTPDRIAQLWDEIMVPAGFSFSKFVSGQGQRNLLAGIISTPDESEWINLFHNASRSEWAKGKLNFSWLLDPKKLESFLNGQYQEREIKMIDSSFLPDLE